MRSHSQSIGWCLGLLVAVIASGAISPTPTFARDTNGAESGGAQANIGAAKKDAEAHLGELQLPPGATSFPFSHPAPAADWRALHLHWVRLSVSVRLDSSTCLSGGLFQASLKTSSAGSRLTRRQAPSGGSPAQMRSRASRKPGQLGLNGLQSPKSLGFDIWSST